jgi:hypothetical protein
MRHETYKAEDIDEIVWLRLNRLKSVKLCENLIRTKLTKTPNSAITEEIIKSKAIGLSSAIDSAIGYWQVNPQSVNAKVLSRYYFLLQMTIAEQVSSVKNTDDLKTVQKHTENGHGLATISNANGDFPTNYYTLAIRSGHFYSYVKSLGINTKTFDFEKRPRKFEEITDNSKLVSLIDLFRRIPELSNIVEEYTDQPPLSFHIGHSNINMRDDLDAVKEHIDRTGKFVLSAPITSPQRTTYVSIYSESVKVSIDYLSSLGLPLTNFRIAEKSAFSNERIIVGQMVHPTDNYWHQCLDTYHSSYAPTSLIVPLWGATTDIIVINFTLLYTLSIIVRYLPDLWYRINSGDLNHIGSLTEYYVSIIDHIVPLKMLERITEAHISIHQPGSLFGPM